MSSTRCAALFLFLVSTCAYAAKLDLFFAYAKEELTCFRDGAVNHLIGDGSSQDLIKSASMIVFLQLAHRPSQTDMDKVGDKINWDMGSCEASGGSGLDSQMNTYLMSNHANNNLQLLQINQYAEDDPEEAEQSLLSVWYDPSIVEPASGFAYKNNLNASAECVEVRMAKTGSIQVTYDKHLTQCANYSGDWWRYGGSKSSLVTKWVPKDGSPPFAIFGSNLPSAYVKGKNQMLKRAMRDVARVLGVPTSRVFIIGDMNTRLLSAAYNSCSNAACHAPTNINKEVDLSKQGWEVVHGRTEAEDDIDPCGGTELAYASSSDCQAELGALQACRRQCLAEMLCSGDLSAIGDSWSQLDPKRGAGGFDSLADYFYFPPDKTVDKQNPQASSEWRFPTYKRLPNIDVARCASAAPFLGTCTDSPSTAAVVGSSGCVGNMSEYFQQTAESKSDRITPDDPAYASVSTKYRNTYFVKPQMGWLDSFGYSKALADDVDVKLFQDRPVLTMGDHGAFVAAASFETGQAPVVASQQELDIFFAYTKEELTCFRDGAVNDLIGKGSSTESINKASMVVLLQLAHRPSQGDMEKDQDKVTMGLGSCEAAGGIGLDTQMGTYLAENHAKKSGLQLLQINQYAEDEPEEPEQSLLSIWYDPNLVEPASGFAYKNNLNASAECVEVRMAKTGTIQVTYDKHVSQCANYSGAWSRYGGSKSSLVTKWVPKDGSPPFAIFGSNLPSAYIKGKNQMLERAMVDVARVLDVPASRVFIIGDMNTRLLSSAWDSCSSATCHSPADPTKAVQLSKQGWEIIHGRTEAEDDIDPCMETPNAYGSSAECERVLSDLQTCRKQCLAELLCSSSGLESVGETWQQLDPKRGAGGFDLLADYFNFPPDKTVDIAAQTASEWRHPTYKRLQNVDVAECASAAPFLGTCSDSPLTAAVAGSSGCEGNMSVYFEQTTESKSDRISPDDPAYATVSSAYRNKYFVKPQMGWLDSFGYSKGIADDVSVQLFQDRPIFTMGDHSAFVAAVKFLPGRQATTTVAPTTTTVAPTATVAQDTTSAGAPVTSTGAPITVSTTMSDIGSTSGEKTASPTTTTAQDTTSTGARKRNSPATESEFVGAATLQVDGATKEQIEQGVKTALTMRFSVQEASVSVTATQARRLAVNNQPDSGATTWDVQYTIVTTPSDLSSMQDTATALRDNPASFQTELIAGLANAGVDPAVANAVSVSAFSGSCECQTAPPISSAPKVSLQCGFLAAVVALFWSQ